jgi:hypothetical protein
MKKAFHTKTILMAAVILSVVLFALPVSALGLGWGGFVYHYEGDIEGLYFIFGEDQGLPVSLPDLGEVTVLDTLVQASGRETLVITPFGRYIYHAKVTEGIGGTGKGTITANAIAEWGETVQLIFEFDWARLLENFMIEGDIPEDPADIEVPDDVNLFFKVSEARLIQIGDQPATSEPFNLMFQIRRGDLRFIWIW